MTGKIKLKVSDDDADVAYVSLPDHPGIGTDGCVKKTLRLLDHIPDYEGADIMLDFDADNRLIGIEILA